MHSSLTSAAFVALACLLGVQADTAPAVQPVQFRITMPNNTEVACLAADEITDGANVVVIDCDRTFPSTHTWSVEFGGAASGTGPASPIHVFGDKCLDVRNGGTANGTPLQIWECSAGNTNQMWNVNADTTITWAANPGKCVDLTGGNVAQETPVQLWDCGTNNPNQHWVPFVEGSVETQIHWNPTGESSELSITGTADVNGAPVVVQQTGLQPGNSTWFVPGSNFGQLRTFDNKCLDVTNGIDADGTKLQLFDCTPGNTNQIWEFSFTDGSIRWAEHTRCVDLTNGNATNGTQLQLWTCITGSQNQMWLESPNF